MSTSFVFGTLEYIIAVLCISVFVCLIYFTEMLRTRCWYDATAFNFTDIKAVILSTSAGGTSIARRAAKLSKQREGTIRVALSKGIQEEEVLSLAEEKVVTYQLVPQLADVRDT